MSKIKYDLIKDKENKFVGENNKLMKKINVEAIEKKIVLNEHFGKIGGKIVDEKIDAIVPNKIEDKEDDENGSVK